MKFNTKITFKVNVRCPRCNRDFTTEIESPNETISGKCQHCGEPFKVANSNVLNELSNGISGITHNLENITHSADKTRDEIKDKIKDKIHSEIHDNMQKVPGTKAIADTTTEATGYKYSGPQAYGTNSIDRFKTPAKIFNAVSFAIALWVAVFPRPYLPAVLICSAIPLIALLFVITTKGFVKLVDFGKPFDSSNPNVSHAFVVPSLILAYRGLDPNILGFEYVWRPMFSLCLPLALISYRYLGKKFVHYSFAICILLLYSFGATIIVNCAFDKSKPVFYKVKVIDKRTGINGESVRFHYIKVSSWGPRNEANEISVSGRIYDRVDIDSSIAVQSMQGFLNVPWFRVIPLRRQ
ncbi:MAG: hypothetical protein HQK89_16990 [Nitrospirae bacterium]|nr:hypothetical protein [Nitrospirota bacterium]